MSSAPRDPDGSSHPVGLLLRVVRPGGHADEFYLAGGLTIGRSMANTIVLAGDDSVARTHARVEVDGDGGATLRCAEPDSYLTTAAGPARELALGAGIGFRVGKAEFECLSGRPEVDETSVSIGASCPFCTSAAVDTDGEVAIPCPNCGQPILPIRLGPTSGRPAFVPADFGDYVAIRFIARGGMGLVLEGTRVADGVAVAIKVLPPGTGFDRGNVARFELEAVMMARVEHPNVVKLLGHDSIIWCWSGSPARLCAG
jgi:hypothetical protein